MSKDKLDQTDDVKITKTKIINLLKKAENFIWISSSFNLEFYSDKNLKKEMSDAFNRVNEIRIIVDAPMESIKREMSWLFELSETMKEKLRIRQNNDVLHWVIVDGKHIRLEKPHQKGIVGVKNVFDYNISSDISIILMRNFDDWWKNSEPVEN